MTRDYLQIFPGLLSRLRPSKSSNPRRLNVHDYVFLFCGTIPLEGIKTLDQLRAVARSLPKPVSLTKAEMDLLGLVQSEQRLDTDKRKILFFRNVCNSVQNARESTALQRGYVYGIWKESIAEIMRRFFENVNIGLTTFPAIREAQWILYFERQLKVPSWQFNEICTTSKPLSIVELLKQTEWTGGGAFLRYMLGPGVPKDHWILFWGRLEMRNIATTWGQNRGWQDLADFWMPDEKAPFSCLKPRNMANKYSHYVNAGNRKGSARFTLGAARKLKYTALVERIDRCIDEVLNEEGITPNARERRLELEDSCPQDQFEHPTLRQIALPMLNALI